MGIHRESEAGMEKTAFHAVCEFGVHHSESYPICLQKSRIPGMG